jgi:hypothetical protein
MASATINVPVTSFVAAGSGFCPTGALTIASNPPPTANRVSIDPNNSNNIIVANPNGHGQGAITLNFVVPSAYTVCGLAITNAGLSGDGSGNGSFSLSSVSGSTLGIVDHYSTGNGATWKLYIAILNSSGQLGLIDPGIENSDAE